MELAAQLASSHFNTKPEYFLGERIPTSSAAGSNPTQDSLPI
jgi:hypothetical protein